MNMAEKGVDDIDDIMDMVQTMKSLGVPSTGLRTLDEMKQRVKETLKLSEKKSSWTAKEVRFCRSGWARTVELKLDTINFGLEWELEIWSKSCGLKPDINRSFAPISVSFIAGPSFRIHDWKNSNVNVSAKRLTEEGVPLSLLERLMFLEISRLNWEVSEH